MFSSNEAQKSPGETSTLPEGEHTVSQTTLETTTTNNSNTATITTNPDNNGNNNGGGGTDRISIHFNHLKKLLEQMKSYLTELKTPSGDQRCKHHEDLQKKLQDLSEKENAPSAPKIPSSRLSDIRKEILKLNQQLISSLDSLSKENSPKSNNLQTSSGSNGRHSAVGELVNVHQGEFFSSCSFFREIQEFFYGLDRKSQFLLSCFTVFPENAVVKRRIFVYWGLGEVELRDAEGKSPEKIVDEILEEFQEKGLIKPAIKKRKQPQHVKSYRMDPLVRSATLKGNPVVDENVSWPRSQRLCLQNIVEPDERKPSSGKDIKRTVSDQDLENAVTLFNVNEPFPDLELARLTKMKDKNVAQTKEPSAADWLSKMKSAKVVCLGSWPGSAKSHIEVQSREFLKGLTNMKDVCLQGISRIKELPRSIGPLRSLLILDLKECHNLEILSEEIANLTNLWYLDVSDCYLLADMPKGLEAQSELRVLKRFVISNRQKIRRSGTLHDLKRLRKLTINARRKDFPTGNDLSALQELGEGVLRNLTIVWGPAEPNKAPKSEAEIVEETKSAGTVPIVEIETLPRQLKKLDLQCFPKSTATWLTPESLPNLEKLYVRGGNLATLGESKWSQVKILRLKYLNELKTTWKNRKNLFQNWNTWRKSIALGSYSALATSMECG
uniref:Disease resistance R13L4/SHOC-2-like LRR domain-containing protein n=1 Tax=Quercus lobata TaxID=97700 RepID=A0A7N2N4P9_QUELO